MNVRFPFVVLLSVTVFSLGLMTGCGQQGQTGVEQDAAQSNPNDADHDDRSQSP